MDQPGRNHPAKPEVRRPSAKGKYSHVSTSSDQFAAQKERDLALDELKKP